MARPTGDEGWRLRCEPSTSEGKESFADYNVWREDFDAQMEANRELDNLRDALWSAFEL